MQRTAGSPSIDRSHIAPVTTREELIYLLSHACELEHGVACIYLFASYSLKSDAGEGGMTPAQAEMVRRWKRRLVAVGVEEMLHLAQLTNVLTAIGGAPHFRRTNFPVPRSALPINDHMTLAPFSIESIERFMAIEMPEPGLLSPEEQAEADAVAARVRERSGRRGPTELRVDPQTAAGCEPFDIDFTTQGEFYHKIMSGIACIPEDELFIGPPEAQANARFVDFESKLVAVTDRKSALAAIQMVIEQGEAPTAAHSDAHFWVFRSIWREYREALEQAKASGSEFNPVRPVAPNPMTRFYDDTTGGTLISDPLTHQVADLFNGAYDTMLLMLLRFFAHTDESETELEKLARGTLRLMTNVTRPLGEALAKMPVGHEPRHQGKTAGAGFGYNRDIHLLPHKRSAWIFFGERLHELASVATKLRAGDGKRLPPEVEEAAAGLQALALEFAPRDKRWNAGAELAEFRALEKEARAEIKPSQHGPFLVTNVDAFFNSKGEKLPTSPEMALCRCGQSASKPFCDGTHARVGFSSHRDPTHTPDGVVDYAGANIVVHFNKLQCSAAEECARALPEVFRHGEKPWIRPDRADSEKLVEVIRRCPSGALRYSYKGETGPAHNDPPSVRIRKNGPYEVRGSIPLRASSWSVGATRENYALCRCGASKNKPFCDGSHWRVKFKDDVN
ncbi:MAG: CDGSH iron-sulfur domain-containing protein [Bradyrhizobiaceae bacterium]|nr:CDGSH iron-sulfur domain-containing protein [Bradyrhizobiaceae bacterium]